MTSQIPILCDTKYESSKTQTTENNYSTIQNSTNAIYRTAIEKTSNLGKRTCNEYKTIFEDVKYKVNYKNNKSNSRSTSILNITNNTNRNAIKKEEMNKIRSVFNGKSKDRFSKK